jgi:hypothetical protein
MTGVARPCPQVSELPEEATEFDAADCEYPSVKVPSLDRGHAACASLLRELWQKRDLPSLEAVQREVREHFEEEEALFRTHGFGGAMGSTSHAADHVRILAMIEQAAQVRPRPFVSWVVHASRACLMMVYPPCVPVLVR